MNLSYYRSVINLEHEKLAFRFHIFNNFVTLNLNLLEKQAKNLFWI